ncbi:MULTISPECIES: fumarylacetoacetate hydrolase family protein [Aneurinibacillus]|jgi:2-keto-4-pentenoate hydratase/2-oxohepta-3-ene-1,7-dioic acid hydratase in catechol pathway|uniref:2-hydroxyhepta-2,4-diene-1,7-dioate isomerase n=1 Tax=Aneurinibacillus danicus TaxID=267746 RepID=A0A511VCP6_9BACL|nr:MULTISPECIES: fumarylacetoacetate hydrolase family protein [Aneurinibacillus]GEN36666.1 2-hydroxyhepta-2,4-diene-1,7-dioate isomerase [Aneurinibacillus danicus]
MITVTFEKNGAWHLGVKTEKGILDVSAFAEETGAEGVPLSVDQVIKSGEEGKQALSRLVDQALSSEAVHFLTEEELAYGPCVTNPQKIICVGLNYKRHAEESNMALPEAPLLFSKFNNTLTGHRREVKLPAASKQVDYEVELAIVIGKEAKDVEKEEALSYVYGYCTANDLSARDLQFKSSQWLLGKTCDGFSPIGPYLVSADEAGDPQNLRIRTWVNGEVRQDSNTSDMIFYCDEIVSYISRHMTLYPGDIILTGTPEGVILGLPEDKREWLKDGDEVTVEIENLGRLTNTMRK